MNDSKIILSVAEASQNIRGKNIVLLPSLIMDNLKISSGDFILVGNQKKIAMRAMRSIELEDKEIGIDGITRGSLDVSIGEKITIYQIGKINKIKSFELSILENDLPKEEIEKTLIPALRKEENKEAIKALFNADMVSMGQRIRIPIGGEVFLIGEVTKISPKDTQYGKFSEDTKISISDSIGKGSGMDIHYEDIGGLKEEIEKVREMVEFPMKHPDIFQRLGISAPKGVLLTGPPGTGKTLLAKAVATETDAKFISIAGPEIMSKYHGGSEENLRGKFEEAEKNSPAIIFIDEIDAIAPKRGETNDQAEKRVVTQLLTLMDGLKGRGQVVVMAATNRPDDLDEALRRPGRFDRELKINPPTEEGRKEILGIHTRNMPIENKEELLSEISNKTIGYTGADLEVLCKEAALRSVKPYYSSIISIGEKIEEEGEEKSEKLEKEKQDLLDKIIIKREHFVYAMKMVEPSAMREVLIKKPNVKWEDIGGLQDAKDKLRELIELPLLRPELYKAAGIKPSKGVLLFGPPGTGKTLLAKAVATEANANFISIKGPELISKWVGESEKHVREIFKKAKQVSPAIIFFDEFDSISKSRGSGIGNDASEKVVNQLLTELDGVEDLENVMIVAATNRKDLIDPAILRPGRIDSHVELKNPDLKTLEEIYKVHTKEMPLVKDLDLKEYAKKSEGWTGADVEAVCRNAGINSIKRNYKLEDLSKVTITHKDFENAFETIRKQKASDAKFEMPDMTNIPGLSEGFKKAVKKENPKEEKKKIESKPEAKKTEKKKVEKK